MSTKDAIEKDIKSVSNPTAKVVDDAKKILIDSMDPELREIYEKELKAYQTLGVDTLTFNYERGCVASTVQRSPKGDQSIALLSKALDLDKSTVYKTITFSSMYSDLDDLNAVVKRAKDSGFLLTWSHYASVVHIKESSGSDPHGNRRDMIDRAIKEKLSVRALATVVKEEYSVAVPAKPVNRGAHVKSLVKKVEEATIRYQKTVTSGVEDIVSDFAEVVEKVESPEELLASITSMHDSLVTLTAILKRVLVYTDKFTPIAKEAMQAREKVKKKVAAAEEEEGLSKTSKPRKPSSIEVKIKS